MFNKIAQIAVCALVMGTVAYSATALADDSIIEISKASLEEQCADVNGRFTKSWAYNDQGLQWGERYVCETVVFTLACQDGICTREDLLLASSNPTGSGQ